MHQAEIDLATVQIDPTDLHLHPRTNGVTDTGSLAAQLLSQFVKAEIFAAQLGDVHQAFHVQGIQGHENAEAGRSRHHATIFFPQMLAHVFALEPSFHITAGFVGAALIGAAMQTSGLPGLLIGCRHAHARRVGVRRTFGGLVLFKPLGQLGMGFAGHGQVGQLVLAPQQDRLDHPVHQQIGVTADRAGEMGVGLIGQAEVTAVDRRVDRLLHGAQKHGVDLLRVRTVFGGLRNFLELAGVRIIADAQANAHGLEVIAQDVFFLGRRSFVHPEQAGVLTLLNEVCTAHVRRQHRFFNQAVRFVAYAGHDFFNAPALIADDLGFGGFKVHCTTHGTRSQQGFVHVLQIHQVGHALLALGRFRAACVSQNRRHLGVGKARMAVHDRWVKLIGMDFALGIDQHVAHHAQAVHIGVERAQTVGQLLGQHGDDAAREIHAGGPVVGIDVDVATGLHIVAHVGNGHQQTPALATADFGWLAIDRIVKVAGIFAVDRDQGHIAQIHTVFAILGPDFVGQALGLLQAPC